MALNKCFASGLDLWLCKLSFGLWSTLWQLRIARDLLAVFAMHADYTVVIIDQQILIFSMKIPCLSSFRIDCNCLPAIPSCPQRFDTHFLHKQICFSDSDQLVQYQSIVMSFEDSFAWRSSENFETGYMYEDWYSAAYALHNTRFDVVWKKWRWPEPFSTSQHDD